MIQIYVTMIFFFMILLLNLDVSNPVLGLKYIDEFK